MKEKLINKNNFLIFPGAIVQLIGGYRDGLKFGDVITFDNDQFLEARPQSLRPFLKEMLNIQIFQQFIDERLLSMRDGFSDEFEKEIRLYSEKISKRKFKIMHNIKEKVSFWPGDGSMGPFFLRLFLRVLCN